MAQPLREFIRGSFNECKSVPPSDQPPTHTLKYGLHLFLFVVDLLYNTRHSKLYGKSTTKGALGERKRRPTLCHSFVVSARWQHYIRRRFAVSDNGKEAFSPILNPDADPDQHQNLITFSLVQF